MVLIGCVRLLQHSVKFVVRILHGVQFLFGVFTFDCVPLIGVGTEPREIASHKTTAGKVWLDQPALEHSYFTIRIDFETYGNLFPGLVPSGIEKSIPKRAPFRIGPKCAHSSP